ncbi:MAG TPA: DNA topoisomerase, partial [Gemmatimonadales bacterium]|nr:DNA topoisomerase [Gemmatimonadales bacterium]
MATAPKRTKRASSAKAESAPAEVEKPARKAATRAKPKAEKARARAAAHGGDALVIVESPTKAKTIGKYLGRGYDVKATIGHLRDLPTRELGVDVDNGFEPKYVTIKGKTKTLAELKKAAKTASTIYLATDPDREGEAIAWHVADQITPARKVPVHRVLFEEITRDAVVAAMESPTAIDEKKVEAQQARRILDRLVGYKASPILWRTIKTGLSAGRVQTVALRLIVEREREIRAFTPQEYWTIEALCASGGQTFEAGLAKIDGHKPALGSEAEARAVVDAVRSLPFVVSKVEKRRRNKRPAAPFTTSTVQQEAAKKLGFSSRRTMR